jgi:signal transduction histidine kinase
MSEPTSRPNPDVGAANTARLEAELASAKRQLDDTRRELDAFAYSVSHDLRGPLRALNGFSRLLNDEARDILSGDTADYLARIVGATRRLELLLEDLLILSRAGRAKLQVQPLGLNAMAREIAASLDAREPGRSVDWQFAEVQIQADPALLRSALEQLLGNAFKFTRTRERALIELIAERSEPDASETVAGFSIRDNGVGFDMSFADRLFAPFQRLHPASMYEGNGIGLALVQRIVRRHGGRAWLLSVPEQGTQAFVRLWEAEPPPRAAS